MRFISVQKSRRRVCETKMKVLSAVFSILLSINAVKAQAFDADEFCADKEVSRHVIGTTCTEYVLCYQSFNDNKVKGQLVTCQFETLFNPVTGDCTWGFNCNREATIESSTEATTITEGIPVPAEETTTTTERTITPPDETITDEPPVDLAEFCATRDNRRYAFGTGVSI